MNEQARFNQEFGLFLHKAVALVDRQADRALRAKLGISLSQFLVMLSIDTSSGFDLSQQMIADNLGINKAAVSRHLDQLVASGLVQRITAPNSRRQNQLLLTSAGIESLRSAQEVMQFTMTRHYIASGQSVANQMLDGLKAICESLEREEQPPKV